MNIVIIILIISAVSILFTYILNLISGKKRFIKYLPAIILFPFMAYNFIAIYSAPSEGFEDLGRFAMGLLLLSAIVPSLICAVAIDIFKKKNAVNCMGNSIYKLNILLHQDIKKTVV